MARANQASSDQDQTQAPAQPPATPPVPEAVRAIADVQRAAKLNRVLATGRVQLAETVFSQYHAVVDPGTTRADLENPAFWAHHAKTFRRNDLIHVDCADGSFDATLKVRVVGVKAVSMHVRHFAQLEAVDPEALQLPSGYTIGWGGDIDKFRVLRGNDLLKSGFESRHLAQTWLTNHLGSLQR